MLKARNVLNILYIFLYPFFSQQIYHYLSISSGCFFLLHFSSYIFFWGGGALWLPPCPCLEFAGQLMLLPIMGSTPMLRGCQLFFLIKIFFFSYFFFIYKLHIRIQMMIFIVFFSMFFFFSYFQLAILAALLLLSAFFGKMKSKLNYTG